MISKHCALAFFPFFENSKLSQVFSGKKNWCLKGPYMNIHWRTEGMFVCNIDPRSNNSSTKSIQKAQRQQWSVDLKQWAPGGSRERCINGILYKTKFLKCTHKYHSPVSKTGLLPNRKCSEFSLRKSTEKKKNSRQILSLKSKQKQKLERSLVSLKFARKTIKTKFKFSEISLWGKVLKIRRPKKVAFFMCGLTIW